MRSERERRTHGSAPPGDPEHTGGFRTVSRALATAEGMKRLLEHVCLTSLEVGEARGVYIERVDLVAREVTVVASAGWGSPPLGTVVPYPGSIAEDG